MRKKIWRFLLNYQTNGRTEDMKHINSLFQFGFLMFGHWFVISREEIRGSSSTWDFYRWCEGEV